MKKIIAIAALICGLAYNSNAQSVVTFPLIAGDSIVNAGTVTKDFQTTGAVKGVAVQVVLTKVIGTGGGTVQIQGSLDGTNYKIIGSTSTITDVSSQNFFFYVTSPLPRYFRVLYTGTGTEVVATRTYYKLTN